MSIEQTIFARDYQAWELRMYREIGKHPERITYDSTGKPYIIGDDAWNMSIRDRREFIEPILKREWNAYVAKRTAEARALASQPTGFATTAQLGEELGLSKEEAEAFQAGLARAAGSTLTVVKP